MSLFIASDSTRSVRAPGPRLRRARLLAFAAFAAVTALLLAVGSPPHTAEAAPAPSPTPTSTIGSITAPTDGQFIGQNSVLVTGTKAVGSTVAVSTAGFGCPAAELSPTTWSCSTVLPNGADVVITATETLADLTTRVNTVTVAVLGPPTIDPTQPQSAPGAASGTGLRDSTIHLMVDGVDQSCNAVVAPDGRWLCTIAKGPGSYTVKARQSIPGRGTSGASPGVILEIRAAPPVKPPEPVLPPPAPATPVIPPRPAAPEKPVPIPSPTPSPSQTPSQSPNQREDALSQPWFDRPIFPGPGGETTTIGEALTNWGSPTDFGTQLPTLRETVAQGNWAWAPLVALLFVLFFALPLRLLATTLRGKLRMPRPDLLGRNRSGRPLAAEDPAPRNPWLMGLVPLAATAGMITISGGLGGEVRYLRLLFAIGLGLAILNVVGVAIATRLASSHQGVSGRLRFLPVLLLAAALAALFSRVTGIEPPLISGVLIGTGFAFAIPARARAIVNLAQVGAMLGLAVLAWIGHSWLGPALGFWASVLSETLATICLVGIGSAVVLMLPVGSLPGRVILEWSPGAWFAAIVLASTVAAAVILAGSVASFPVFATAVIITVFAATCVAVWAWSNYLEVARA